MGQRVGQRVRERALHLVLPPSPSTDAYPEAFSESGKLGENFSAGCSWGNFVLLFSTFDDFLPNRCRYNAKCSYMPCRGAHTQHKYKGLLHKESAPGLQRQHSYCLQFPLQFHSPGHLHAGRQGRQAGWQPWKLEKPQRHCQRKVDRG